MTQNPLTAFFSGAKRQVVFWPLVVFFIVNGLTRHNGSVNAASRFALTVSMVTEGTFTIDHYVSMTPDWSQTPDGHYYSNKGPGPSFLAAPVAKIFDLLVVRPELSEDEKINVREETWASSSALQAIFIQWIPFCFLVFYFDRFLMKRRVSRLTRAVAGIALIFGTTPCFLMNTMFGHGLAALAILASVLFALDKRVSWSAFAFGVALLTDYGAAFVLPGLLWIWFGSDLRRYPLVLKAAVLGALLPAAVWVWYHTVAFGSPLTTSHKYLAQEWVTVDAQHNALWGIFSDTLDPKIVGELLFGRARGLLFTQPWVLFLVPWCAWRVFVKRVDVTAETRDLVSVALTSLVFLLVANASFNGWHGGETIGPRYLSCGLFLFPLVFGILGDTLPRYVYTSMLGGLGVSVIYFAIGFPQDILCDMHPWAQFIAEFFARSLGMKFKVAVQTAAILLVTFTTIRSAKQDELLNSGLQNNLI